uniref:LRAT domain-containing protein n=1 Tax=Lepisosteus oculatus TaxID=7918 RepID=W5M4K7_LEPOC
FRCVFQFPEPHRGDLLEFPRDRFTHWGLYMGDGYVIHLAPIGRGGGRVLSGYFSSVTSSHANVLKELLKDVAGPGLDYRVQNKDQIHPPLPVDAIMQEAEAKIGTVVGYSFPSRNCEHFVTELRYGRGFSAQSLLFYPSPHDEHSSVGVLTVLDIRIVLHLCKA